MIDRKRIRELANDLVKNNAMLAYGIIIIPPAILGIIVGVIIALDIPYLADIINIVISFALPFMISIVFWKILASEELSFKKSFSIDNKNNLFRYYLGALLMNIYTTLWTLLFIIPGIIKAFSYAMTPFVMKNEPGLKPNQAITRSRELMDGYKKDLFFMYIRIYIIPIVLTVIGAIAGFNLLYAVLLETATLSSLSLSILVLIISSIATVIFVIRSGARYYAATAIFYSGLTQTEAVEDEF